MPWPFSPRPKDAPRRIPAWAWVALKRARSARRRSPKWFQAWRAWRLQKKPPTPAPKPIVIHMFDDVNVSLIPKDARAVAAYVDGHYQTWAQVVREFPNAKKVRIAVFGQDNGDALDVEPGDASISQAAAWVKRQKASWSKSKHDVRLPVVYTAVSWAASLQVALSKAGLRQGRDYLLWTAHYSPSKGEHICNSGCGFGFKSVADATQYTDRALNRSLDESLTRSTFWK